MGNHKNVADKLTKPMKVKMLTWSLTSIGFKMSEALRHMIGPEIKNGDFAMKVEIVGFGDIKFTY